MEITQRDVAEYERNCRKIFFHQMYADDKARLDVVYRSCASKTLFHTLDEATSHGKCYNQHAYRCPHCHGYHLTSHMTHGELAQKAEWKVAAREFAEAGLDEGDIDGKVWMAAYEDEPITIRIKLASRAAALVDREMAERITCRRGTKTYERFVKVA
jgi:hypothetical protein